jgi:hypothetical protein
VYMLLILCLLCVRVCLWEGEWFFIYIFFIYLYSIIMYNDLFNFFNRIHFITSRYMLRCSLARTSSELFGWAHLKCYTGVVGKYLVVAFGRIKPLQLWYSVYLLQKALGVGWEFSDMIWYIHHPPSSPLPLPHSSDETITINWFYNHYIDTNY